MKKSKELKPYKNKKLNKANFGNFTHNDYKVYLHLVSMIVKVDIDGNYIPPNKLNREYTLSAKDYNTIFNCNMKHAYDFLRKACDKLMNTNITIHRIEDNTIWKINICSSAKYNKKEGCITIRFTDDIMPYLSQVREKFVMYDLKEVAGFSSLYTTRLYELLQEFKDTGYLTKSILQLREIFATGDKLQKYSHFKTKTFVHAVYEINNHYNADLKFEEIKEGRKVAAIKFTFNKTKIAKRYRQDGSYTNEYIKPKEKSKYPDIVLEGQLSFEEKTQNQEQAGNAASNIIQNLKIN
jgi:plasmid replication initiation protein